MIEIKVWCRERFRGKGCWVLGAGCRVGRDRIWTTLILLEDKIENAAQEDHDRRAEDGEGARPQASVVDFEANLVERFTFLICWGKHQKSD